VSVLHANMRHQLSDASGFPFTIRLQLRAEHGGVDSAASLIERCGQPVLGNQAQVAATFTNSVKPDNARSRLIC
jgi:hypothetical protein